MVNPRYGDQYFHLVIGFHALTEKVTTLDFQIEVTDNMSRS